MTSDRVIELLIRLVLCGIGWYAIRAARRAKEEAIRQAERVKELQRSFEDYVSADQADNELAKSRVLTLALLRTEAFATHRPSPSRFGVDDDGQL